MSIRKTSLALLASAALTVSLSARDQIKIVGSSTVYPFSSSVAEEFGATTKFPTPVVESTGSGGGMKLFCAGNDLNTPDITNASRRMKSTEFQMCEKNGVTDITEAVIGYDGIAFAQSISNKAFDISKTNLALAVAKEVPSKDGKSLIANPYKKWSDIDASLPNREIIVYGPPKSSGTRDAFEELVLQNTFKKMAVYTDLYKADKKANKKYKKYSILRTDGVYVEAGENDNLIVQKLEKNKNAFGVFGFSFLEENDDKVQGATINGVHPTPDNISSSKYPVSRSLFFYIKNSHAKEVPAMNKYVDLFMSDKMIGQEGILTEIGLIPLPADMAHKIATSVKNKNKLTLADLKHK
ncbi:PstS family phosphate ABC transporter substrate-binding protein [Poseidonibacter lekithochrous]|uniref:PstS family phosphate ABC transporter substrate-binding protein n=1 Tax=Poseidonibacter TaxID=2321187 RepID=UPI001C085ED4|nr:MULTISPECIES: PstS family phosphate ABC transporter substrate-binding protein [Poseidonibacter]MBU3014450.1 PstS family phosphate ABC transporter substrate-binding protein [Poseidonibacter lekithochrous]MDO6827748.1 PstS family phosphate ABC transporter substrate-binding protein [Poseidonibacter sp. 1_MG-2023]